VNFAIDPHTITFETTAEGLQHVSISCSVAAYASDGTPVKGFKADITNLSGNLKSADYQRLMQHDVSCKRAFDLKPGKYTLRLGALDRTSRLIGTATASLTVN
jgi:hypothetical protein